MYCDTPGGTIPKDPEAIIVEAYDPIVHNGPAFEPLFVEQPVVGAGVPADPPQEKSRGRKRKAAEYEEGGRKK